MTTGKYDKMIKIKTPFVANTKEWELKIDGIDLSDQRIFAVKTRMAAGEAPMVVIHAYGGMDLELAGRVAVVIHDAPEILDHLDHQEIEDEAGSRLGWGDEGTLASKVIEVIREKVNGIATYGGDQGLRGADDSPCDTPDPGS